MVLRVPSIDKALGLKTYVTKTPGIGGIIRETVDDFSVQEVLLDGSVASIEERVGNKPLGATAHQQKYLFCALVKRNWDTLSAVLRIAKELGINQSRIQIAGIKDARAATAQHITIEGASVDEVLKIRIRDIEVRPIGYFRDGLAPFYLLGNKFRVRIRGIKPIEAEIADRIAETVSELDSSGGIPNFFGHQRFGTKRPITHLVGKAIVKGDFEEAAMLFLTQTSIHEHPESKQARNDLHLTRDFSRALQDFPRQLRYERAMLSHLSAAQKDFIGAFKRLPPKLQELFVQAYQAYLFNLFLSERLKEGCSLNRAEIGDFVVNLDRSGLPIARTGRISSVEVKAEVNDLVRTGRARVALPLVGTAQRLSGGAMGQIQREILEKEGVEPRDFKINALAVRGGKGELRAIASPMREFSFQTIKSEGDNGKALETELSFMLLRGSYATMLLREVMKPNDPVSSGF